MTSRLSRTFAYLQEEMEQGLSVGAQVYISLQGEVLADAAFGLARPGTEMTQETLVPWLSAGKPLMAVLFGRLWERELVDIEAPAAQYVPEFGQEGKSQVKVRHLLTHTSGLALYTLEWVRLPWSELLEVICRTALPDGVQPGRHAAYDPQANWLVLGEIVRRVARGAGLVPESEKESDSGKQFAALMRAELFEPLGMKDVWLGIAPDSYEAYGGRMAVFHESGSGAEEGPRVAAWDTPQRAAAISPGGGARGPVRQLGRFYEMLLRQGRTHDRERYLLPPTVAALTSRQRVEMFDTTFRHIVDWGLGFLMESSRYGMETVPYGYGRHASTRTFGHGGMQSTTAYCDPEHGLVVATTFNGHPGEGRHSRRVREFNSRVYEDLGLTNATA